MSLWRYSFDRDARGFAGYRIDSDTVSLIAWLPVGDGAEDAEQNARLICEAVNAKRAAEARDG